LPTTRKTAADKDIKDTAKLVVPGIIKCYITRENILLKTEKLSY
jgi:hypothetical protein